MNPQSPVRPEPDHPARFSLPSGSHRKVAIAVDLSEEIAYAVRWAVQNNLRPGDTVILLHVCPTFILYGAFLNGPLEEDVYVTQPPGFEVSGKEHMVYVTQSTLWLETIT